MAKLINFLMFRFHFKYFNFILNVIIYKSNLNFLLILDRKNTWHLINKLVVIQTG